MPTPTPKNTTPKTTTPARPLADRAAGRGASLGHRHSAHDAVGRRAARLWAACVGTVATVAAIVAFTPGGAPASAAAVNHATLVPHTPATGFPIIRSTPNYFTVNGNCPNGCTIPREVLAVEQAGRYIVSGGNFFEVELPGGTVLNQKYFAAWNIDTKQLVCGGKFTFDNEVLAIHPGPTATTVYVGGRFTKITGADGVVRTRTRLALLNLADCSVDKYFTPLGANDKVTAIVRNGARLYVGGDFTAIGGLPIETIAEVNASTGAVASTFNFPTTGEQVGRVKALALNPGATRLYVAGRFGTMTHSGRSIVNPTAVIDVTSPATPVLTAHSSSGFVNIADLQSASVSPSGNSIGLAYGTATVSDYVYLVPTTESAVRYSWIHFMRDSSFGIAVSNNAVYVTGHFCKIDPGPGTTETMTAYPGLDVCTGTFYAGGVWRSHIAALSLTDGTPLAWNPGQFSVNGGKALTLTTRGLLSGFDGERVGAIRTGATAFFDFGPQVEDTIAPSDVTFTSPVAGSTVNQPVLVAGRATDNVGVISYRVAVRSNTGLWLQTDGVTLASTYVEHGVFAAPDGSLNTSFTLPAGIYTVRARAVDIAGLRSANEAIVKFTETGNEGVAPTSTLTVPVAAASTEADVVLSGVATDNVGVANVAVQVRAANGSYVQDNGVLATTANDLPVTGTPGTTWNWTSTTGALLPAGRYSVQATAIDAAGNTKSATATITLVGTPPVISVTAPLAPAANLTNEDRFTVAAAAADNGQITTFRARLVDAAGRYLRADGTFATKVADLQATVTGLGTASTTLAFDANPLPPGTYRLTVTAIDGVKNTTSTLSTITVAAGAAPHITVASPAPTVTLGEAATFATSTTDDHAVASISATVANAVGAHLQADGSFAATPFPLPLTLAGLGTPSATANTSLGILPAGSYSIAVTSADGGGNVTAVAHSFVVGVPAPVGGGLAAPVVIAIADRADLVGTTVVQTVLAADPDGGAVSYTAAGLPTGLTIDQATGRITGTPTAAGAFPATVTATDDEATTTAITFLWSVATPALPCTVTPQAAGVLVDWLAIAGVTSYTVRVNGGFLATVNNADAYAHPTGTQANTYAVRYRTGGVNVDIACTNA